MTPDEVVKVLEEFNRSPFTKANLSGNEWTAWKKEILEANFTTISIIQDYQKLRGITKDLVRKVRDYADIGGKEFNQDEKEFWVMCEKTDEVETYLQQPLKVRKK